MHSGVSFTILIGLFFLVMLIGGLFTGQFKKN